MKVSTEVFWKFENKGNPHETKLGSGNFIDCAKGLAEFMASVTINNRILVTIERKPIHASQDESLKELESFFDNLNLEDN